jgi:hypothetical protein
MVLFLILLLGALFVFFGVFRILSVRRICWNEGGGDIYLHYGWEWNRRIFQIPRESIRIKMSVAGETKLFSHFYHGDTILLLELKNRSSAFPIHLLSNSSRKAIGHIADILSVNRVNIEDSTLAWETVSDGRTISFSKTGIGRTSMPLPYMRICCCSKQGHLIVAGMRYSMMRFWVIFIMLGFVGLILLAINIPMVWILYYFIVGFLCLLTGSAISRYSGLARARAIIDSKKSEVIIQKDSLGAGSGKKIVSFKQVAGVQVCPRHVEDGEGAYAAFGLNLVIHGDADVERINLLEDWSDEKVMSYAQQIATAMNKPIFDHSMIKKKKLADTIIL